jgi:hypothetical protein
LENTLSLGGREILAKVIWRKNMKRAREKEEICKRKRKKREEKEGRGKGKEKMGSKGVK